MKPPWAMRPEVVVPPPNRTWLHVGVFAIVVALGALAISIGVVISATVDALRDSVRSPEVQYQVGRVLHDVDARGRELLRR